jgi:hypothetical protein
LRDEEASLQPVFSMRFARLLLVCLALVASTASALVFLPIATLIDPATRGAGADLTAAASVSLLERALSDQAPGQALTLMLSGIRSAAAIVCCLPILVIGLIGETARVGSWLWYTIATGALTAAIPFVARGAGRVSDAAQSVEIRFATVFFLTGVVAGAIYWFVAGRSARPSAMHWPQRQPRPL